MKSNTLSIILPVHNERDSLEQVIQTWNTFLKKIPSCVHTFILCEDGSTDGTQALIQELQTQYPIINLSVPYRRGYGKAVIDGIQAAKSDFILCIDSDGQCHPSDFAAFWKRRFDADFVMGWRYQRQDPLIRIIYSKCFFLLHKILFKTTLHDPSCPYVLGHKTAFQAVQAFLSFLKEGFWWGFVAASSKTKKTILEIKIKHEPRLAGITRVYRWYKMPGIMIRNGVGLIRLKLRG